MGIDDGGRRTISRGLRLRRWATALSAPLAAAGLLFSAPPVALAEAVQITFLHINDVYEISAKNDRGGFAELMTLLEAERAAAEHSITTFGGDLLSPSVMSGLTRGAHMIELMNALGADVAVTGNHEFDFGPDVLARRIEESEFPWLAATASTKRERRSPAGIS